MGTATAKKMKGVAIDHFGGLETLSVKSLPVPQVGDDEILIHVESAGIGAWDPFEREGGFAKLLGIKPKFPYVLGSDGGERSLPSAGRLLNSAKATAFMRAAWLIPRAGFTRNTPRRRPKMPLTCRTRFRLSKPGPLWSMR